LRAQIQSWRQRSRVVSGTPAVSRADYLSLAGGIIHHFAKFQTEDGRILDPYEGAEKQYSTPAFACAAAVLATNGRPLLLAAAIQALEASLRQMIAGQPADRHGDFFTVLMMHAYLRLASIVPSEVSGVWREQLSLLDPQRCYRDLRPDPHNWNVVAIAGEYLRILAGVGGNIARQFIAEYLPRHLQYFTCYGMYRDPNDPLAYDAFARVWIGDMLFNGYDGPCRNHLLDYLDRGAWTSMFMQSPTGEFPAGGRSGGHQWNEAQLVALFEMMACSHKQSGDLTSAGACKRSAHLAFQSIKRWIRPEGDLWIVKNRFDPGRRFGFESYSFHSQYNLLTAALLSLAFISADDSILEWTPPSEAGGFAFFLKQAFHKLFMNCSGLYLEADLQANPHFQSTGIVRVHAARHNGSHAVQDSVSCEALYGVDEHRPTQNLAIGPEWNIAGRWQRLADLRDPAGSVSILDESPQSTSVHIAWPNGLMERLIISEGRLEIEDFVPGADKIAAIVPFLREPGIDAPVVRAANGNREPMRMGVNEPTRYGFVDAYRIEADGQRISYSIVI